MRERLFSCCSGSGESHLWRPSRMGYAHRYNGETDSRGERMSQERVSMAGLLAAVAALGVFALLGSVWLGAAFAVLLTVFAMVHVRLLCGTCRNLHCALNTRSPHFLFGMPKADPIDPEWPAGDTRWVPIAIVVTLAPALWGAWLFHPVAVVGSLGLAGVSFAGYYRTGCANCTNECPLKPPCAPRS